MSENKSRIKYYIAAGLVVIIVALILIIPRYNRYMFEKRSAEIKGAMEVLRLNVEDYWKMNGSVSGYKVEKGLQAAKISQKTIERWNFVIAWKSTAIYTAEMVEKLKDVNTNSVVYVAPYKMIMASATAKNPIGEGRKIWFDGDENSFHGFGVDKRVEPDWSKIFPNP